MATSAEHRSRVGEIDRWLVEMGVDDPNKRGDIAVDLADILAASGRTSELLTELLAAGSSMSAQDSLDKASEIEVQLFTEMANHLDALRGRWSALVDHLSERAEDPSEP
jgi:hypothetical protein